MNNEVLLVGQVTCTCMTTNKEMECLFLKERETAKVKSIATTTVSHLWQQKVIAQRPHLMSIAYSQIEAYAGKLKQITKKSA